MTALHRFGDFVRNSLAQIPLPVVRVMFVGLLIALLIWIWTLPRSSTVDPSGSGRWHENLKTWATVAVIIQMLIYGLL